MYKKARYVIQDLRSSLSKAHARRRKLVNELDLALLRHEEQYGTCSPKGKIHGATDACLPCDVLDLIREYRRAR